jgi:hypothetical protein
MIEQIVDCQTSEIKNVDTETGEEVIIQPAQEEQPTNEGE